MSTRSRRLGLSFSKLLSKSKGWILPLEFGKDIRTCSLTSNPERLFYATLNYLSVNSHTYCRKYRFMFSQTLMYRLRNILFPLFMHLIRPRCGQYGVQSVTSPMHKGHTGFIGNPRGDCGSGSLGTSSSLYNGISTIGRRVLESLGSCCISPQRPHCRIGISFH